MTGRGPHQLSHWRRDRRALIEHRLYWHGSIGLADLMEVMGISRAQASKDLNEYIADHPGHLFYNKSARTYVMGDDFETHYLSIEPSEYLADLAAVARGAAVPNSEWIADVPDILTLSIPARGLPAMFVRNVLMACAQRRNLTIEYQSMSTAQPTTRDIAPHGIAHDGFRWHTRAYCFKDHVFKDFVLSRILNSELAAPTEIDPDLDTDWVETIALQISAHPSLSGNQKRIVELDYGMKDGTAQVVVRKCLLFYNLKMLGLDTAPDTRAPQDQQIVLVNRSEVRVALGRKQT
ncbi:MAG: WYL domain-containing protein [Sulfitobacter sp.]|uniref:WYL domain-containing protein n=1 Tax=Sulfitobacter sp. TaxID=1903071 RepID=UPI00329A7435